MERLGRFFQKWPCIKDIYVPPLYQLKGKDERGEVDKKTPQVIPGAFDYRPSGQDYLSRVMAFVSVKAPAVSR